MRKQQQGFTLVEVLVALAISSLLLSLTFGSIVLGQRSAHVLYDKVEETEMLLIGWQFLHRAIGNARPVPNPDNREDHTSFSGDAQTLSFVASLPTYSGSGGLTRILLGVEQEHGKKALLIRVQPYPMQANEDTLSSLRHAELLDNIESLEISYLGNTEDGEVKWFEEWSDPRYLPNLVRIRIKPAQGKSWPEMIFSPVSGSKPLSNANFDDVQGLSEDAA